MAGYPSVVRELYNRAAPSTELEVGRGEGLLAHHLVTALGPPARFECTDLRPDALAPDLHPSPSFRQASIYELPYADNGFDLVLCCESSSTGTSRGPACRR
jgi:ubiquinone/menaquinone biosynthesis C-methylase UbiE